MENKPYNIEAWSKRKTLGLSCDRLETGWTWTLVSVLGTLLSLAEKRYGKRCMDWTILGIEFGGEIPCVWYPGNCGYVSIKLAQNAELQPERAVYQLAHETIHLLHPSGGKNANNLEEGLAECFADEISQRKDLGHRADLDSYIKARDVVRVILDNHTDAIRNIREEEPALWKATPELILKHAPSTPRATAEWLCQRFDRGA